MSSWIMSIIGVCFMSVVVDLMLPDGKTNALIKRIVSYVIIFVVLMPIPKLLNNSDNIKEMFSYNEIGLQDNYIYNVNQLKLDTIKTDIENELEIRGILGATVSISADIFLEDMEIYAVYVDLYNMVISDNLKNKDIKTEVVSVVLNYISIKEDKIIIYE